MRFLSLFPSFCFTHMQKLHKIALKTAGTRVYSTHPFETSPPPPPRLSRSGAFIELPALNAPFRDNRGGLSRKGVPVPTPPHSHPVPTPFPQPIHSRQAQWYSQDLPTEGQSEGVGGGKPPCRKSPSQGRFFVIILL